PATLQPVWRAATAASSRSLGPNLTWDGCEPGRRARLSDSCRGAHLLPGGEDQPLRQIQWRAGDAHWHRLHRSDVPFNLRRYLHDSAGSRGRRLYWAVLWLYSRPALAWSGGPADLGYRHRLHWPVCEVPSDRPDRRAVGWWPSGGRILACRAALDALLIAAAP